jgi:DNA-binding winged helix-turn-helix (wHTH) protein
VKQQNYPICDATYDPLLRQFMRDDGHVETIAPLEGKVFLYLLENVGECIERGLIFNQCWGNVIVSEQALTNVISKLRKTLNRVTCGCATIRTVSKTGYSLEIDDSIKSNIAEVISSQTELKELELSSSAVDSKLKQQTTIALEPLVTKETSADESSVIVSVSELTSVSNQTQTDEQTAVSNFEKMPPELEPSRTTVNGYLVKIGYLIALICFAVTAFNFVQSYYQSIPYFVDKAEYRDSYTDNTNHYFFHIVRDEAYSLPAITQKLTEIIPTHCNVDVFVRVYPSVNQPENDAMYMLVRREDGEALNYVSSIFDVESSFESLAKYMSERSYFCE